MVLNTKLSNMEPSWNHLNPSVVSINQSSARSVTSIPLMNGGYSPQVNDILFDRRSNFRVSKITIAEDCLLLLTHPLSHYRRHLRLIIPIQNRLYYCYWRSRNSNAGQKSQLNCVEIFKLGYIFRWSFIILLVFPNDSLRSTFHSR